MVVDLNYIPKGWKKVKIPKVLFFQEGPGVRNWQFTETGVKLLNVGNINNGKIDLSKTSIHLSEKEANGKYKHFLVDDGDLLIACSGIVVDNFHNKIAFAEKEHLPLCLNTSTMRFKALNDEVDLNYFKYYLQTVHFTAQLRKLITGSAQLNFGPSHIKKIDLLLPPLETQKNIAQILDDAAALRNKTEQLTKEYDALAQSIFLDMFGDTKLNPLNWEIATLSEICTEIIDCPHSTPNYVDYETEFPCIRTTELQNGNISWKRMKYLDEVGYKLRIKRLKPQEGDIIYGREGTIGEAALIPKNIKLSLGQRVMLFRANYKLVNNVFLLNVIRSKGLLHQALRKNTGSTVSHVNVKDIKNFKIILPDLEFQKQFAEKITLIEQQKELAKQELKESEDLFNCLLQKAFKGELI